MESRPYEILRTIGQGAVARVALARAPDGALVAHKALLADLRGDEEARRRFLLGGALLGRIEHPHVVRLVEVLPEVPALVLEFAPGG